MKGKNSHISERKFYYGKNHSHFFRGGGGGGGARRRELLIDSVHSLLFIFANTYCQYSSLCSLKFGSVAQVQTVAFQHCLIPQLDHQLSNSNVYYSPCMHLKKING